ncbi:MAG: hypothetical protein JST11_10560 [Acidobacteria bacterium]|nr:hypothetical protein [Acidobacteriota bacterium]
MLGPVTLAPGDTLTLPASLAAPARPGGVTISLTSSDPSKVRVSPDNIYVPEGATAPLSPPRVTGIDFGSAAISASAYGLAGTSQIVQVAGRLSGPQSQTIIKGATAQLMFALASPLTSALTLTVSSDNPAVAIAPPAVTIPANGTTAVVPVTAVSAGTALVRVSALPYVIESIVSINVQAPGNITVPAVSMKLGQIVPFPVTLGTPAPAGGAVVSLTSSDSNLVQLTQSSILIPAGATTPAIQPQVIAENIGVATITVSAPGYITATQQAVVTATITMLPQTLAIPAGGTGILSMMLSSAAPSGVPVTPDRAAGGFVEALTVQLSSSDSRIASVQPNVKFYPDGSSVTTVVVVVTGVASGTAIIHASALPAVPDATATVIVGGGSSVPSAIVASGGTPQSAQSGMPFGLPLSALVTDAASRPVPGITVTFTPPASGPGLSFAGGFNTAVTDSLGIARSATATANGLPGTYTVTASVPGVAGVATFLLTNTSGPAGSILLPSLISVGPGQSAPFPITLTAPAPSPGVAVALTSSNTALLTVSPSTVFIGAGATTPLSQPLVTGVNFGSSNVNASAAGYNSGSQAVQVSGALSFLPPALTITGLVTQSLSLLLNTPAPANGLNVQLSSNNPGCASVPPSATMPPGATVTSFLVTAVSNGQCAITASAAAPNIPPVTASVTVTGNSDIVLPSGIGVGPGDFATFPVALSNPARTGVIVALASSDTSKVTVNPGSVYISQGSTTPGVQPIVTGVNFGTSTISASAYGLAGTSQIVRVTGRLSGPLNVTIQRGTTSQLTFVLPVPASGALTLMVTSDNPGVATVPASVTIPAMGTAAVVPVTGVNAGTTSVRVSALPDLAESVVTINVQAPGNITLPAVSMKLGQVVPFPIALGTPAPPGGLVVSFNSSDANAVAISPSSVFIQAGATTPAVQPQVTATNIGVVSITASAPGYITASQQVVVTATITIYPQTLTVPVGGMRILSLELSSAAPSGVPITPDRGAGGFVEGLTVQLSSSDSRVATLQPAVQFYPDGSSVTTVTVVVTGVAPGTAVIRASALPSVPEATATIIVQ